MINFTTRRPAISVVMPVFNTAKYLDEAIRSIVNQSLYDFEFIIIDDGSTDESFGIAKSFQDKRIKVYQNTKNIGNYPSRNFGMNQARGKYICVMDGDDIALPNRLEKQYRWMESNPLAGICGSYIEIIPYGKSPNFILDEELLKVHFLSNNHCSHPSLILRKELLEKFHVTYDEQFYYSADFDICARGFKYFKVQNIRDVLLQYRIHPDQISSAKFEMQKIYADKIRIKQLVENLRFDIGEIPVELHLKLMKRELINKSEESQVCKWISQILERNKTVCYYEENRLKAFLCTLQQDSLLNNVCKTKAHPQ